MDLKFCTHIHLSAITIEHLLRYLKILFLGKKYGKEKKRFFIFLTLLKKIRE